MLRVPSSIEPNQFQSLNIQRSDGSDMTFVAYRSDVYPERNEVFFEEHAVIVVLEGEKKFSSPTQELHVRKGDILFFQRGCYSMNESIDNNYRSLVFFVNEKLLKEFVGQHITLFQTSSHTLPNDLILSFPCFLILVQKRLFWTNCSGSNFRNSYFICSNSTQQSDYDLFYGIFIRARKQTSIIWWIRIYSNRCRWTSCPDYQGVVYPLSNATLKSISIYRLDIGFAENDSNMRIFYWEILTKMCLK